MDGGEWDGCEEAGVPQEGPERHHRVLSVRAQRLPLQAVARPAPRERHSAARLLLLRLHPLQERSQQRVRSQLLLTVGDEFTNHLPLWVVPCLTVWALVSNRESLHFARCHSQPQLLRDGVRQDRSSKLLQWTAIPSFSSVWVTYCLSHYGHSLDSDSEETLQQEEGDIADDTRTEQSAASYAEEGGASATAVPSQFDSYAHTGEEVGASRHLQGHGQLHEEWHRSASQSDDAYVNTEFVEAEYEAEGAPDESVDQGGQQRQFASKRMQQLSDFMLKCQVSRFLVSIPKY